MAVVNLLDEIKRLLESYAEPCIGDCSHSQCPLLRDLQALRIKASLEQARLTVKPTVDKERGGEEVGDLMNMRLTAQSDHQPALQPPEEKGAHGHIHRFGIISIPPEFGHSYWRCVSCPLAKLPPDHDPATCEACAHISRARVDGGVATVEEREFLDASVAVWREIDRLSTLPEGYKGLPPETDPRIHERAAWEKYRATLDAATAPLAAPELTALQEAYNQGVEDSKCAIRAESQGGGYWAATFINAIARRCSPFRYTGLPANANDEDRERMINQALSSLFTGKETRKCEESPE